MMSTNGLEWKTQKLLWQPQETQVLSWNSLQRWEIGSSVSEGVIKRLSCQSSFISNKCIIINICCLSLTFSGICHFKALSCRKRKLEFMLSKAQGESNEPVHTWTQAREWSHIQVLLAHNVCYCLGDTCQKE